MWRTFVAWLFVMVSALTAFTQRNEILSDYEFENVATPDKIVGPVKTVVAIRYLSGEVSWISISSYSTAGKRTKTNIWERQADVHRDDTKFAEILRSYTYDAKTNNLDQITTTRGDQRRTIRMIYDSENRLTEQLYLSNDGKLFRKRLFKYKNKDMEVLVETRLIIGSTESRFSTDVLYFDEHESLKKRVALDKDGSVIKAIEYAFERGNLLGVSVCCNYTYRTDYRYEFDKVGNWVARVDRYSQKDFNKDAGETQRIITYYSKP